MNPLWWQGPDFLTRGSTIWSVDPGLPDGKELPERRAVRCLTTAKQQESELLTRFSLLRRLLRVTGWIQRWWSYISQRRDNPKPTQPTILDPEEIEAALMQ